MPDERQTPAERPPKKRMSRGTRVLVIIVCVLLAIALLLVGTVLILSAIGRNALTDDDGMNISRDDVESLGSGTVRYNDRLYRYNTDIVTILLMGVDEQVKQDASGIYGNANQSDANILAVLDLRNKEMTLISISRDAMCTLDILDSAGEHVGTATAQLALAYAYGDGAECSCELTSAAVSRLFYDLPIPVYGSIYMQGIRQLVDSVGGVTVTPDTSIPGFAAGQPVTLTGQLTESYIRYRADSTEGNNQRMQRQKQVVLALMHKMLAQVKEDPASILALYNNVRRNTTTNINTAMMVYLAQQASGMHFSDDIVNVPGTSVMGEQRHAEYQVDFDELQAMNPDIYAWIKIPDTDISYAVLQRDGDDDQEYYSKHSENGAYYSGGSIFSQSYNRKDFSDPMTVLYGHNLRNGRMFAQLNDFSDAEVFESHRYIYVYLPDRMLVYEIFAAYPHSSEHLLLCHDFADAEDFAAYFDDVRAQKSLQANVREDAWPQPGDRVLTLSTCYRGDNHQRYLVQGKLVAEAYAN